MYQNGSVADHFELKKLSTILAIAFVFLYTCAAPKLAHAATQFCADHRSEFIAWQRRRGHILASTDCGNLQRELDHSIHYGTFACYFKHNISTQNLSSVAPNCDSRIPPSLNKSLNFNHDIMQIAHNSADHDVGSAVANYNLLLRELNGPDFQNCRLHFAHGTYRAGSVQARHQVKHLVAELKSNIKPKTRSLRQRLQWMKPLAMLGTMIIDSGCWHIRGGMFPTGSDLAARSAATACYALTGAFDGWLGGGMKGAIDYGVAGLLMFPGMTLPMHLPGIQAMTPGEPNSSGLFKDLAWDTFRGEAVMAAPALWLSLRGHVNNLIPMGIAGASMGPCYMLGEQFSNTSIGAGHGIDFINPHSGDIGELCYGAAQGLGLGYASLYDSGLGGSSNGSLASSNHMQLAMANQPTDGTRYMEP